MDRGCRSDCGLSGGCSVAPPTDKSGSDTVVLRLATIDRALNNNGQQYGPEAFVGNLEKVFDGRIKVDVTTDYENGAPKRNPIW